MAVLAWAQTWEQPRENTTAVFEEMPLILKDSPKATVGYEVRSFLSEEPTWTEAQRLSLDKLAEDIQKRQDDRDKEILEMIKGEQRMRIQFSRWAYSAIQSLWDALRSL